MFDALGLPRKRPPLGGLERATGPRLLRLVHADMQITQHYIQRRLVVELADDVVFRCAHSARLGHRHATLRQTRDQTDLRANSDSTQAAAVNPPSSCKMPKKNLPRRTAVAGSKTFNLRASEISEQMDNTRNEFACHICADRTNRTLFD